MTIWTCLWEVINIITFATQTSGSRRHTPIGAGLWNIVFTIPILFLLWYHHRNPRRGYQIGLIVLSIWDFFVFCGELSAQSVLLDYAIHGDYRGYGKRNQAGRWSYGLCILGLCVQIVLSLVIFGYFCRFCCYRCCGDNTVDPYVHEAVNQLTDHNIRSQLCGVKVITTQGLYP